MSPYLRVTFDLLFPPSMFSHLFLVIPLVSAPGYVHRILRCPLPVLPSSVVLLETLSAVLGREIHVALDFLASSVLYSRSRRSTSSCGLASVLLGLPAVVDVRPSHLDVVAT